MIEPPTTPNSTIIDFNVYFTVLDNKTLLNSLIHQWIDIYNKTNRTRVEYVKHDVVDVKIKEHKKINITVSLPQ